MWSCGGSARIFVWSGVLLHCGTVLFNFKKDCILDLNLLHVNDEGKEDVEVEVFLEEVPVEVNGCLSPRERLEAWGQKKALGCGSYLRSPYHKKAVEGAHVRSMTCMLFWQGLSSGSLWWIVCVILHPVILGCACIDCRKVNVDVRC